jgi:iron transport multicopper oxidase
MHNNTYINTQSELSSGQGVSDNAILPFQAGKKYRIRVINMSALASEFGKGVPLAMLESYNWRLTLANNRNAVFHLTMQNHTMQIIELDGIEVSPYEVDVLPVAVAQRYSIYVEAKNETNTDYAFMVMQDTDM